MRRGPPNSCATLAPKVSPRGGGRSVGRRDDDGTSDPKQGFALVEGESRIPNRSAAKTKAFFGGLLPRRQRQGGEEDTLLPLPKCRRLVKGPFLSCRQKGTR